VRFVLRALAVGVFAVVAVTMLLAGPIGGTGVRETPLPPGAAGEVASRILPSVVDVRAEGGGVPAGRIAIGTGVIVDATGLIVTNDHVVTGETDQAAAMIEVTLRDGRQLDATLVARDPPLDLALLRVVATGLQPARFAAGTDRIVGEQVVAVGAPGILPRTVAAGTVVAIRAGMDIPGRPALTSVLETSACLRPGYSGGPTVDRTGRVIGISFAGTPADRPGCRGFAIPSATVLAVIHNLSAVASNGSGDQVVSSQSSAPVLAAP
jgi:putative serine protease PepD